MADKSGACGLKKATSQIARAFSCAAAAAIAPFVLGGAFHSWRNPATPAGYANFIREPLRAFARDEARKCGGRDVKDNITPIGEATAARLPRRRHLKSAP